MAHNLFTIIPYKGQLIKLERALSAKAYYRQFEIDLLTGIEKSFDFSEWIEINQNQLMSTSIEKPRVVHLFYELGFFIEKEFDLLNSQTLLAIDITYETFSSVASNDVKKIELILKSYPSKELYREAFEQGYRELLMGNCYQFNLTYPFLYSFESIYSSEDFLFSLWQKKESRGAYGSATYIPYFKKLFLSNSPECLFQFKEGLLSSMPIKGTILRRENEDWRPLWKKLSSDKKNQAELFMISDLMRNDLSRIDLPRAIISKKKAPLLVPGLLHQYSQIDVALRKNVTLGRVIEKIFPGGSITGAPKRRVMRLIYRLENRERGFYCGSTLILHKEMKSASINIRSSVVDFERSELLYQAGGGVTLKSSVDEEYDEMTYKRNSFIHSLTL
jgi:anthranilate/para-aminobenzoate synthase component I